MQEENSQPLSSRSPRAELSMKHNVDRNTGMMTYQERGVHNTFRSMRNAQYKHVCSFLKFSAWCDPSLHVICMKIVSPQILMVAADLNIDKLQEQAMASHSWTGYEVQPYQSSTCSSILETISRFVHGFAFMCYQMATRACLPIGSMTWIFYARPTLQFSAAWIETSEK